VKRNIMVTSLITGILFLLSVMTGCSGSEKQQAAQSGGDQKVVKLRLSHTSQKDKTNFYSRYAEKFAELTDKYTNGGLQVQTYGEGELYGNYIEMTKAVMDGSLDMGYIIPSTAYPSTGIPEAAAPMIPRLLKTEEAFYKFIERKDGYGVIDDLVAKRNIKRLDSVIFGKFYIYTPKPISKPEDFKGLIMRLGGGPIDVTGKALGMTPSPLSIAEVYSGLQQKVVDGAATGLDGFVRRKWFEVAPYIVAKNWMFTWYNIDLIINNNAWGRIPEEQKKIITDKVVPELHAWAVEEAHKEWAKAESEVEKVGGKWVALPDETIKELDGILADKAYPEVRKISPVMSKLIDVALDCEKK